MGEYAMYRGEQVKIGTCEQMYYLRADQAHLVTPIVPGNVDPVKDREHLRFRFPFPDEDNIEPGDFGDFDRSANLDVLCPEGVDHDSIQFQASPGYLVSLPCPESADGRNAANLLGLTFHRNGWPGGNTGIHSQRVVGDRLVTICKCVGCGALYRLPTAEDAIPYIEACGAKGDELAKKGDCLGYSESERAQALRDASFWYQMGSRIARGYTPGAGNLPPGPGCAETTPEPDPAAPEPANDTRRHLNVAEACAELRALLRKATGRSWSVTHGRGTAYGWITVHAMPKDRVDGYLSDRDARTLAALFGEDRPVHCQGLSISPDARELYVEQLGKGARYVLTPSTCQPLAPFPKAAP